jgi:siroheme synthase-like protein
MLPLIFDFEDKPVLVIGAGRIGCAKASQLVGAGARVTMIAEDVIGTLPEGLHAVERRRYRPGDLEGFMLVISAIGDGAVNDQIVEEARQRSIWLNAVDDPPRCDFYFTANHRAGEVVVAVSTEGASPALAQVLRNRIAALLPDDLGEVAATLRAERDELHRQGRTTEGIDWRPRIAELLGPEDARGIGS